MLLSLIFVLGLPVQCAVHCLHNRPSGLVTSCSSCLGMSKFHGLPMLARQAKAAEAGTRSTLAFLCTSKASKRDFCGWYHLLCSENHALVLRRTGLSSPTWACHLSTKQTASAACGSFDCSECCPAYTILFHLLAMFPDHAKQVEVCIHWTPKR